MLAGHSGKDVVALPEASVLVPFEVQAGEELGNHSCLKGLIELVLMAASVTPEAPGAGNFRSTCRCPSVAGALPPWLPWTAPHWSFKNRTHRQTGGE